MFIYYERPLDNVRLSKYWIYDVNHDFFNVFGILLKEKLVVEKTRTLLLIKNARIHLDEVKNLGFFLEIEIVINSEEEDRCKYEFMDELKKHLKIEKCPVIQGGYEDLMIKCFSK